METNITKRPTINALEEILYQKFDILNHGFIRLIDYMGDDSSIVQAARVSYGKGTKQINQDQALINYLMRHQHTTPFEMCEIKLHLKMPIFVARQWIRHRTASINEYSARYSILSKEFYIPDITKLAPQSTLNKQGRADDNLSQEEAEEILFTFQSEAEQAYVNYQKMLNYDEQGQKIDENKKGISRELARINLNLGYYTEFYWKVNLHNLLHFLKLRADSHAQYEIRVYAEQILKLVKLWVPKSYAAFDQYIFKNISLSENAWKIIKSLLAGKKINFEQSNLSKREWDELHILLKNEENEEV